MATCSFCKEKFKSEQGVRAHMKWCDLYHTDRSKKAAALGKVPKAVITPDAMLSVQAIPPIAAPDISSSLRELEKAMRESSTKQHELQTPQQRRREIVQAAKAQVINHYRTPVGQVTVSLRGAAKLA